MDQGLADHLPFLIAQQIGGPVVALEKMGGFVGDDDAIWASIGGQEVSADERLDEPIFAGGEVAREKDVPRRRGANRVQLAANLGRGSARQS